PRRVTLIKAKYAMYCIAFWEGSMRYSSFIGLFCVGLFLNSVANAQSPSGMVRIGILNDQSGPYADFGGKTSVDAARIAVEDIEGKVLGKSNRDDHRRPSEQAGCGFGHRATLV